NWLPPITFTPIYVDPIANLTQLIWPALAVGYRYCAVVARMIRSSLLEVLNEDYIRTARAKGVFEKLVISRHALRNALLPAVTVPRRPSAAMEFTRQQPLGAISFVIICVMMFAGVFCQWVAPYNPLDIDFASILAPPSWQHWGGTDAFGRDIFSRIIWGS